MCALLKNDDPEIKENIKHMNIDWLEAHKKQSTKKQGKRIIKASASPKIAGKRDIPIMESVCERPEIKTLGTGDCVEGIEIVCQCGQKMVIHFNYDGNEQQES